MAFTPPVLPAEDRLQCAGISHDGSRNPPDFAAVLHDANRTAQQRRLPRRFRVGGVARSVCTQVPTSPELLMNL